ncbi:hypothetical protein [Candidatus Palauibacter sp.]|uniref:hypothetical protein n=1 Tax=Candidatus Palauibacter sp. TaxID=3101350 RepID=UPI003B01996A
MLEFEGDIRSWRTQVERRSSLSPRELDELEDHLRARVDLELDLNPALTPATALRSALEGLGEPSAISKEFAKAGQRRSRRLLLAGWALYAASFLFPAYAYAGPHFDRTTYGYEIVPELVRVTGSGPALAIAGLWLPNLILLTTLSAWRHRRPSRRGWTAWIVGATGALPLGLGLLRFGDPGAPFHAGIGFWMWCASFIVVATALWLRSREWASVQPHTAGLPSKLGLYSGENHV